MPRSGHHRALGTAAVVLALAAACGDPTASSAETGAGGSSGDTGGLAASTSGGGTGLTTGLTRGLTTGLTGHGTGSDTDSGGVDGSLIDENRCAVIGLADARIPRRPR